MKIFNISKNTPIALFSLILLLTFTQCSKDEEPVVVNEEEQITTVILSFQKQGETTTNTVTWEDGQTIPTISLDANSVYSAEISFLDNSDPSDPDNITEEVIEEADEHQVFYQIQGVSLSISSASNDTSDSNSTPLLLNTEWETAAAGSGSVQVYLIHEPTNKGGNTRDAIGGETDVQINFPVTIQ